jgi:hypothetical protein
MPIDNIQPDQRSTTCAGCSFAMKSFAVATLSMAVLFSSASALAGQIYKWTDAEGKVHYGSEKPADTATAEQMKVNTSRTGVDTGTEALDDLKQKADDEAEKIKEEGIPPQPPVPSLPMKEVKQRCQQAKNDLLVIQSRAQLRERNEKGEIRYVSDKEKQQRIKAAKQQVREYCN